MNNNKILIFGGGKSKDIIEFDLIDFKIKKIGEM